MAPRETDTCPSADGVSPPADSSGLKVVSLAMELPVVNDAVSAASAVAGPYMDTLLGRCSSAVDSLDSLACSGLELLTEQVPSLAIPTPDLLEITKDTAFEYLGQAADYLASFKAAQVCLVAGDRGLETAEAAVGALGVGTKTIRRMMRGARAARRAGARRAGPATQARTIGDSLHPFTPSPVMSVSNTSTSKMSPTKKKASLDCAHELLTSGKRNLLVTAVPAAVSDLAECCEIVSKTCGETADECAEVYYYYGKALLELSRLENGVLGNALEGVDVDAEDQMESNEQVQDPKKMSKDEKLEVEEKVADALEENFEQHDKVAKLHAPEIDENIDSEDSAMEESSQDEGEDCNKMETVENSEEKTEEVGNLQLAWETLELAKVVYTRMAGSATGDRKKELEAKLCDAYLCLGEVSIENENYGQAVTDLNVCLEKRKAALPSDSRSIAEAWYQLGLAQAHNAQWKEAEASLNHAIGVMDKRMTNLAKMESSENITKEVADLKALVTEIKERITDHKTMETETMKISKDPAFAGSRSAEKKASAIATKNAPAVGSA